MKVTDPLTAINYSRFTYPWRFTRLPSMIIAWNRIKGQQNTDHLQGQEQQVTQQVDLLNKELVALNNTIDWLTHYNWTSHSENKKET